MTTGPANLPRIHPPSAGDGAELLSVPVESRRLTHQLFRFPAKFHPPVVRSLIELYTDPGQELYEPFCGSGTALVESAIAGRPSAGLDVDPLAVAVARAKTRSYDTDELTSAAERLLTRIADDDRGRHAYERLMRRDLGVNRFKSEIRDGDLSVPAIPNLEHWFRRYVVVDLARLKQEILSLRTISDETRAFLLIVFASIIRNASNADPVPVSGLEVTSHMRAKDAEGRLIDPFSLFRKALQRALRDVGEWMAALGTGPVPRVFAGDVTEKFTEFASPPSAIVTSPPYHNAVDYYRRHQLEMFWLGHTKTHADRLALLPQYIGRPRVPRSHPFIANGWSPKGLVAEWLTQLSSEDAQRGTDFRHYMVAMEKAFARWAEMTRPGTPVVLVVGKSTWNGKQIPTTDLFREIAGLSFEYEKTWWYPVKNRYMSYARRNGADIDREFVLVLRRR